MNRNTRMQRYPVGGKPLINRDLPPKSVRGPPVEKDRIKFMHQVLPDFSTTEQIPVVIVHNPASKVDQRIMMTNKACNISPEATDFAQITSQVICPEGPEDKYQDLLLDQYGFDPVLLPDTISYLRKLHMKFGDKSNNSPKVENSSQYANPDCNNSNLTSNTYPWFIVDSAEDVDKHMEKDNQPDNSTAKQLNANVSAKKTRHDQDPKDVKISDTPRMKVIAEKYTRVKTNNFELRRLDERIVCLEYDVYALDDVSFKSPVQIMRAFFSIKTACDKCAPNLAKELPATITTKMGTQNEDFNKVAEKEVEMLDENIIENKPYLDGLKAVLKKQRALNAKKKKSTLDLRCMYEMARHELPPLDHDYSNTNLLSKSQLQEIKDMILQKCESRLVNVSRKTLNRQKCEAKDTSRKSDSVFYEVLRNFVE